VVEALPRGSRKITILLKVSADGAAGETRDITAVLRRGGSPDPLPLSLAVLGTERGDTGETILCELDLPVLEPGEYTLEITAEDKATGTSETVSRILRKR
jgi:hypothetical protein